MEGRNIDGQKYNKTVICCSCDAKWDHRGFVDSKCWHVECFQRNATQMSKINGMLESGFAEGNRTFYGNMLRLTETESNGRIVICREGTANCEEGGHHSGRTVS